MKIFADNVLEVAEHNELYEAGVVSFEIGINQFSDMVRNIIRYNFTIYLHYLYKLLLY